MKYTYFLFLLVTLSLSLSSCNKKTTELKIDDVSAGSDNFEQAVIRYNSNIISPDWFYSKANVKLDLKKFKTTVAAKIVVEKDTRALIVIKKFGQELGRAYASKDTVIILDRFRKKYFKAFGEEIASKNLPFTFESLQSLMLGKAYYNKIDQHSSSRDSSHFNSFVDPYNLNYNFDKDFLLKRASFKNKNQKQSIESILNDYIQLSDNKIFSKTRDVSWFENEKKQGNAIIEFQDIELDIPKSINISIPKSYTEMSL